jgi:hypothetical protein
MQLRKPNTWGVTSTTDRHAITSSSASLFGSENDYPKSSDPVSEPDWAVLFVSWIEWVFSSQKKNLF